MALGLLALPAVRLSAQCPDGTPPPCARASAAIAAPSANSVGVMLFNNQTRDTAYAYLSDGLATEIATSLARVPRLEVRSPGAVRSAQRGVDADPRVIGRRLNVRYVVEGDFQRGGDRIRISVRLVGVPNGTQRWSEAYTRPVADLLAVQEEIASAVATAIAGELLPQERSQLSARPTRNPEAYDHVLRGNFQLARRSPAGVSRAIEEYQVAARLDPTFAQAHARIALGYALYLDWGWELPGVLPDSQTVLGLRAAERALALDSASADGWMARGYLLCLRPGREQVGCLESLDRATKLDPRNAEAWHQYGSWLVSYGRFDDGIAATRRSLILEPGRAVSWANLSSVHEARRQDAELRADYDSAIAADPDMYAPYAFRAFLRLRSGDTAGARADAQDAMRTSPATEDYYGLAALAAVSAATGDSAAARQLMDRAMARFARRVPGPLVSQMIAMGLVAAGEGGKALDFLERTEPKGPIMWQGLLIAVLDPIRTDPRFVRLLEQTRPPGVR